MTIALENLSETVYIKQSISLHFTAFFFPDDVTPGRGSVRGKWTLCPGGKWAKNGQLSYTCNAKVLKSSALLGKDHTHHHPSPLLQTTAFVEPLRPPPPPSYFFCKLPFFVEPLR